MMKYITENSNIEFLLFRKNVKNINLRIRKDSSVVISANKRVSISYILEFVEKKADWIIESQQKVSKRYNKDRKQMEYISGEEINIFDRK